MSHLTQEQLEDFETHGVVVVPDVIPYSVLDAVVDEYDGVLDDLIDELYKKGEISSRFEGLPFGERFIKLVIETGDVLWETRLGAAAHGYPITYEAGGRQFIAVPASHGGVLRSLSTQLNPEVYLPEGGNALYVFALPE